MEEKQEVQSSYYNVEEIMKSTIGFDDTFEFGCEQCGKCCHGTDIMIGGYDIYRIARHLGKTAADVVNSCCQYHIGKDSHLPVMTLRQRDYDDSCVFLRKGKCQIHAVKPSVCAIYPLGRMKEANSGNMVYFKQNTSCGNKQTHTPREWLSEFNMTETDELSTAWFAAITKLSMYMHKKDDKFVQMYAVAIVAALYLAYDTDQSYIEQLNENMKKLEQILPGYKADEIK